MKRLLLLVATLTVAAVYAGAAQAATATLFGTAVVEGDHVKIVSDTSVPATPADDSGGVSFTDTGVTTFNSITTLSAEFNVTDDACLGGAPRFSIDFAGTTNNVHVYLGTYNATTGQFDCAPNTWIDSGNLIGVAEPRYDLTQFGGPFYGTYAQAQALVGGMTVEAIHFVVDAGWAFADQEQTVLLRKVTINSNVFTWGQGNGTQKPNPARICKALRAADPVAFLLWGTNDNKRNAFGKCVSHHAKLKQAAIVAAQNACKGKTGQERRQCVQARADARFAAKAAKFAAALDSCKAELDAGRAAFLQKYGKGAKKNVKAAFAACVRSND
jgi:hypothetical protein